MSNHKHIKEEKYDYYYGIPHTHTSYSTGKSTPYEAFKYAKDKGLDFLIITDHSKTLDENTEFRDKEGSKWNIIRKEIERFLKHHDKFIPLRGFEASTSILGDINIVGSEGFIKDKVRSFKDLEEWLKKQPSPIVSINHPEKFIQNLDYIPEMEPYIKFVEVGNGSPPHKYTRYEKTYYSLLDKGWHVGALNSQDNHRENWGNTDNLTVVLSTGNDRDSFLDALRERRTYSTESRTLKLMVKSSNTLMGGFVKPNADNKIPIYIEAQDENIAIKKIQVISKGGVVVEEVKFPFLKDVKWSTLLDIKSLPTWFVVRTILVGEKYGISSPIFVTE